MARYWVVDCETTGVDPEVDKVVEIGGVLLDDLEVVKTFESLVNPGIDIPPTSSAIHHLTSEHVKDAPVLEEAILNFRNEDFDYVVAHNAKFDSAFLSLTQPWICTWKMAHRVWPEAPSHSNQALRYWLGLPGPSTQTHAHRALYDAEVTAQIFCELLKKATVENPANNMVKISQQPVLLKGKVGFGEHADKTWDQVPLGYLRWMMSKDGWDENRQYTAEYHLKRLTSRC